jgi:hypothetical protein
MGSGPVPSSGVSAGSSSGSSLITGDEESRRRRRRYIVRCAMGEEARGGEIAQVDRLIE